MKSGQVTQVIDKRYQLSDTADGIAYVEQGHARINATNSLPVE